MVKGDYEHTVDYLDVGKSHLFSNQRYWADLNYKRRIKTEEKAKDVAAAWGTEFIQFLAALAI